jgi:hypothetical protein
MNAQIRSLQEQVDRLYANLDALRSRSDHGGFNAAQDQGRYPSAPPSEASHSHFQYPPPPVLSPCPKLPPFRGGPTSSASAFDVAKSSLQTMGIAQPEYDIEEVHRQQNKSIYGSPVQLGRSLNGLPIHPLKDPLWSMSRGEVVRLCRVFDDDVGMMHPILDIEKTISRASKLFDYIESAARTGMLSKEFESGEVFYDEESNILKMVLASALTLEGNGESELGAKFFENVRGTSQSRLWEPVTLNGLILLAVMVC